MMTMIKVSGGIVAALVLAACSGDPVTTYQWVDWTEVSETEATGNVGRIEVTYTGELNKNSHTGDDGRRNEWGVHPATFTFEDQVSAPETSDALRTVGGDETGEQVISFSHPVEDPIIAILSLGGSGGPAFIVFEKEIEVLTTGAGPWGNGPFYVSQGEPLAINGQEGNGLIRIPGIHDHIKFTTPRYETDYGYQFAIREPAQN